MADSPALARLALYQQALSSTTPLEISQLEIEVFTRLVASGVTVSNAGAIAITAAIALRFSNTGLKVYDSGGDHLLTIAPGSDLTADRTLTITTGDAARIITLSGDPTLADWFDQAVKQASSPTFAAVTLSGGKVAFPATQSASSDANTLDDYEEGTWTPVIGGSGGTSGQTYTRQAGRYIKIGKKVWVSFDVILSAKGTITASAQIQGLPFTVQNSTGVGAMGLTKPSSLAVNWILVATQASQNSTAAALVGVTAAASGMTALTTSDIGNTTGFEGSFEYEASA